MKKSLLCLAACLWTAFAAFAAPVGKQQAQTIARNFLTERGVSVSQLNPTSTGMNKAREDGSRPYYVFNNGQNGGFVIVSGDDRAPLVLGYSDKGSFGETDIPENLSSWLDSYADQIETLSQDVQAVPRARRANTQLARISISPLVMTHWNQYAPYFNLVPKLNGQQCITGCVAVAFAQVMKYYEWPKEATTSVPGYYWKTGGTTLSDLPSITFDWDNMLYDYQGGGWYDAGCTDGETYQTAVAQLLEYCGYACKADYYTGYTSAYPSYIPTALKNYFGYEGNITEVYRSQYSTSDWEDLIYNELYNGRPIVYSGDNVESGHSFVCDGYGEDDYFHINWGWGGMSDGYYLLSILEPGMQGAGGSNAGYSDAQSAIIGIQPGTPSDETTGPCLRLRSFSLSDGSYISYGPEYFSTSYSVAAVQNGNQQLNAQLLNENGEVVYEGSPVNYTINVGWYTSGSASFFQGLDIADGTYEVRLVCRLASDGTENEWLPCQNSDKYQNMVTFSGNTVTYSNETASPVVTCSSFTTASTIYVNNKTNGVAHLSNEGNYSFQDRIYLWVNNELATYNLAFMDEGESADVNFPFTPTATGSLPVKITTDSSGEDVIYEGTITVSAIDANAAYKLEMTAWSIDNLDTDNGIICGGTVSGTITVKNTGNISYSGYISIGHNGGGSISWSYDPNGVVLAPGESLTLSYTVDSPSEGTNYKLCCWQDKSYYDFILIGETNLYKLVAGGYTYWTADGTSKSKGETSVGEVTVLEDAVAVKFFTTPTTVQPNSNPNTLYYFADDTAPSGLADNNVVLNGKIDNLTFNDGYSFYVPSGFTAENASYVRVPQLGANGSSGWETIVLPFAAQKAMNQTDNKQIYWFVGPDDDGKDFWLKSFVSTDGEAVYFDFVDEIRANVPYIIATPGTKWGEQYNLVGKTIAFVGENVDVPQSSKLKSMTDAFDFVGLSETQSVSGYVLDSNGQYFERQSGASLDAFRAYFSIDESAVSAKTLRIRSYIPNAIVETDMLTEGEADVYSLEGVKVATVKVSQGKADISSLPRGIYIVNGKKMTK